MSAYSPPHAQAPMLIEAPQELVRTTQWPDSPAGEPDVTDALPATLSDVEGLLGDVERALHVMASDLPLEDEGVTVHGEAEALRWHLAETARRVRDARDMSAAS